jgi:hypothetical protein
MTPEQALQILNEATAQALLTRQGHFSVQQALQVLARLVQENAEAQDAVQEMPGTTEAEA